jgi:xylulokinase
MNKDFYMTFFMGIDISTTSAKAIIIDESGKVHAIGSTPQPISQPYPLWSEQHPSDWWEGVVSSIQSALAESKLTGGDIAAIGLTGQMHGLVMLDANGAVLRPAILWNDQRTQKQCDAITATIGFERLIELTGNRALTGFTAPKVLWVRENEPAVYAKCAHILLPKDYIRYQLTGAYATDLADGAGMALMNVAQRQWSTEVVDALQIPHGWLPKTYEGTGITGEISATPGWNAGDCRGWRPGGGCCRHGVCCPG